MTKSRILKFTVGIVVLLAVTFAYVVFKPTDETKADNRSITIENKSIEQASPVNEKNVESKVSENILAHQTKSFEAKRYVSRNKSGFIGYFEDKPLDNPIDNIFHIQIDRKLQGNETVWLEYELCGVEDYTGIAHSVNDQLSVGGYIVKKSNEWKKQREQLNPSDLKKGDNVVRFTLPENTDYGFQVKNLSIYVEPYTEIAINNQKPERRLVVNQPTNEYYYGNLGYLQGYVFGDNNNKAEILIDGERIRYNQGTFESLVKKNNENENWLVTVQAIFDDGQVLSVDVPFNKPAEWDVKNGFDKNIHHTEQLATVKSGFDIKLADAHLTGEAGSVEKNTNVSITALRVRDIPALDAGMVNVTAGYAGYRFLPHGTEFKKDIAVNLGYDTTKIPNGYGEHDIQTYFFDEVSHHWIAIPRDSVLLASNITQSRTNHFSDYINAIIKVPESPETQGYTPTSMKDVKAANPATGINLIQPPSANSMGNANLSYPINIPAGRQGMQPQLAISYNSGGGNSWLGLGWDLSVPSISVETRWGVPHYDPDYESETYLMAGEQLSPVAHREAWKKRESTKKGYKQFFPRVEGSFSLIKRYGENPKEYYWEVTDKTGVKYYYGASSLSNGIIPEAVLTDDDGNIAQWALVEVKDLYGNFVKYHYSIQNDAGLGDGKLNDSKGIKVQGSQIYLDRVTYTGHGQEEGVYSVEFYRDRDENGNQENRRPDVTINANYGFKQVTADLLESIVVKFGEEKIRSYELKYTDGAFNKTLLEAIIEKDSRDSIFTQHDFEYFDDVRDGNDYAPYESSFKEWNTQEDGIKGEFISSKLGILNDNATAISGTKSNSWGAGLSANVGLGAKVWSKNTSVGGNYSYSKSTSRGQLTLMDINGDGLPDKLMVKGDTLLFRPQIKKENGGVPEYSTEFKRIIFDEGNKLKTFLKSTSSNNSIGLEAIFGVSIGANYGFGKSITSTYLSDVNGDGLIDIISDAVVYFNYVDDNGNVHFTTKSTKTPNLILSGALASGLVKVDTAELEKARLDNPLHDVVKMWKAPHAGSIKINAPVQLVEDTSAARKTYPADGVIVSIQHKDKDPEWKQEIGASNYNIQDPGIIDIDVSKGDNIYFRVQSIDNGAYDQVNWTPEIFYADQDTSLIDANGKHVYKYRADEDYVFTAPNGFMATPIAGVINIESHLFIPATSDDVIVEILHNDDIIEKIEVDWKQGYNDSIVIKNREVEKEDVFSFKIKTNSNIKWEEINWKPFVYYTESRDTSVVSVFDKDGNPAITSHVVPEYSILPNSIVITEQWEANDSSEVTINPGLIFKENKIDWINLKGDKTLIFTVKKQDSLIYKKDIDVSYNSLLDTLIYSLPEDVNATLNKGESVHLEYHTTNLEFAKLITSTKSQIKYKEFINDTISCDNPGELDADKIEQVVVEQDTVCIYHDIIEHTDSVIAGVNSLFIEDYQIFGHMYRNWGQFAYDGNGTRADERIWEDDLNISEARESAEKMEDKEMNFDNVEDDEDLGNSFEEQGAYNPEGDKFIMLVPYGDKNSFIGMDELTYVTANIISSSRKGQDRLVLFDPIATQGDGATAIDKITKNGSVSFNAGYSGNVGSVGGSYSRGWDKLLTDYVDMNGDRYPDVVTDEKIQYTNHLGALSTGGKYELNYSTEANDKSTSNSFGVSVGGTQLGSSKEPANNPKNSKYALTGNASLSGNYANNETHFTWRDINGDGLPDRINKDEGTVRLNLGYKLAEAENWGSFDVNKGQSISINAGAGLSKEINIDNGSIKAGIGLGGSRNILKSGMQDVNGDGLLDIVEVDEGVLSDLINSGTLGNFIDEKPVQVRFNNGNGFSEAVKWKGANFTSKSKSVNESANIAFTAGFTIFGTVKFTVTPSVNISRSYSKENLTLNDVDGDGFSDYIESDIDKTLRVKKSKLGKVNRLKTVKRPLNGEFYLDYKPVGNTVDMPQAVWALSKVTLYDGFDGTEEYDDGADHMQTSFDYDNGKHDRYERAFYGFGEVHTSQLNKDGEPYRTTIQTFANDNYYIKGAILTETVQDTSGNKYSESINKYELKDREMSTLSNSVKDWNTDVALPVIVETQRLFYEGGEEAQKSTKISYSYDGGKYGNIKKYIDYGDEGAEDDLVAEISYHENTDNHILSVPKSIVVNGGLRERSTEMNDKGKIEKITLITGNGDAVYDMFYDDTFGNLDSIVYPANYNNERMYFAYSYDDVVHNYITAVRDAYGYNSSTTYEYKFGQVKSTTDINGNQTVYEIDSVGRISQITGPYELENGIDYTIRFKYHEDDGIAWAHTQHYDPEHPENPIETSIFIDGFGRVIQTKKDGAIFNKKGEDDTEVMIVSGLVKYDEFGRSIASTYPVKEEKGKIGKVNLEVDDITPTKVYYDILDRDTLTILPDGTESRKTFGFGSDREGNVQFLTRVTDANGKKTENFTDVIGRQTAVKSHGDIWTSFVYNPMNELLEVKDAEGNVIKSEYDKLGRRLIRIHPDAGTTVYTYDPVGNMRTQLTANLDSAKLSPITYEYEFNRLTSITYPENTINNVSYEYGKPDAKHNRIGRIILQEDGTGAQEFFYGSLGEITKNIRSVIVPDEGIFTFETQWEYDTWNRLKKMVYPDGEEVSYNYNVGGLLHDMYGTKKGTHYEYVSQIGYDKFENREYIGLGNGTETYYEHEPDRRRLNHITTTSSTGRLLMDNTYTYDKVNNITNLKSNAPIPELGFRGGRFDYSYEYDDLYRLKGASGHFEGAESEHRYELSMSYSPTGNILNKNQLHQSKDRDETVWGTKGKTTYNWEYKYEGNKPHAPSLIGEHAYSYDANGNTTGWQSTRNNQRRNILWDEENRIRAIAENGSTHHYMYDASGERVIKATGDGQAIYINGFPMGGSGTVGNYTMYVNPYMIVNNMNFTKHFYIEGQRIVSKLGEGGAYQYLLMDKNTQYVAGGDTINYDKKILQQKESVLENFEGLGLDGVVFTAGKSGKIPYGQLKKYYKEQNGSGVTHVKDTTKATANAVEKFRYFYHSDHLGSSSYITDASGEVYQHFEYFPSGETFYEARSDHQRTPYLFNGKELDKETGLYYYGARYYDPRISLWYGVDPMAEKYPALSPFAYTANNPLRFVDPDGEDIVIAGENNSSVTLTTDMIDITVNASSLGIDFGGSYTLQGEAVLSAGLDIVGIVDPSGVADGLNAALQAKNGEWGGAIISGIGLIPYIGDVAKVGKIGKDIKIINAAIDATKAGKNGRKFWTNVSKFDNIKVYKRSDIFDAKTVSSWKVNGKTVTGTNVERMAAGKAPIGVDGKPVNLHHMTQTQESAIAEMTQTFHKKNHSTIHINPNSVPSGIDRSKFNTWRTNYWKNRAKDFE